jgi:hypothetical protein
VEAKSTIKILSTSCVGSRRGSGLLAGELASLWHYPLLGSGLLSADLRLLPPVMSVMSLEREASFWLWHRRPRGNRHRGLSSRSVLHPWYGCDGSERSPCVMPSRRGEAEPPLPAWRREELLNRILYHGQL